MEDLWRNLQNYQIHVILYCEIYPVAVPRGVSLLDIMKTNTKLFIGAIVIVIAGGLLLSYSNKVENKLPNKTVNIGAVLAMTGYASADGEDIKRGIELAKTDLLAKGVTVSVNYFDDATDPKRTIAGFELMNSSGIKSVLGPTWGFQVGAALPIVETKDMAIFLPAQASDNILGASSKAFYARALSGDKQAPTEEWLKKVGAKKVAIFVVMFGGDNWSEGHIKTYSTAVKNSGAEIVMLEKINLMQEADITQVLVLKAKQLGVDAILWTGTDGGAITLIKKMHDAKFAVPVLGTTQIAKVIATKQVTAGNIPLYSLVGVTSKAFADKFHAVYGADKRFDYAESAYDLTMIAVNGELTRNASTGVAEHIRNTTNYKGFGGNYSFDKNGDRQSAGWTVVEAK